MNGVGILLPVGIGYLLGSIPTALWVSRRWFGEDIRQKGSGNAGSTNTYRAYGWRAGLVVQFVDVAKGSLAAAIPFGVGLSEEVAYLAGLAAVVGHIYPALAGFRGGKGMNTLLGAFVVLDWQASLLAVAVFGSVLLLSSMVSLGSVLAVASLPVTVFLRGIVSGVSAPDLVKGLALGFPLLILYTHRGNLRRIFSGTERRVGFGLHPAKKAEP